MNNPEAGIPVTPFTQFVESCKNVREISATEMGAFLVQHIDNRKPDLVQTRFSNPVHIGSLRKMASNAGSLFLKMYMKQTHATFDEAMQVLAAGILDFHISDRNRL